MRTAPCLLAGSLLLLAAAACRQDMHDQPRLKPLARSPFFADRRGSRTLVDGTVDRGQLVGEDVLLTGKQAGELVRVLPSQVPLTPDLLERGKREYRTFCTPCHGATGRGDGMVVKRGFKAPSSYHVDRLRAAPIGYFFDVMTNGFGAMSDYSAQVPVADRWAIAAYIRTLQLSQYASLESLAPERRASIERSLP